MFYLVRVVHSARQCPGVEGEKFKEFIGKFSSDKFDKAHVRYLAAYIDQSCITRIAGKDHVSTFALEAGSIKKVENIFGPLTTDVRQVICWGNTARPAR
jgi:hypothetical protein